MKWLLVGFLPSGAKMVSMWSSAQVAVHEGKVMIRSGEWISFRVARVTSEYVRGSVRTKC